MVRSRESKFKQGIHSLFIFLILFLSADFTWASGGNHPRFKLGFYQILRAGALEKSFSQAGAGMGGDISLQTDGDVFNGFLKLRATLQSGTQDFLDGTTSTSSSFSFIQTGLDAGMSMYPIPRKNEGLNIFLGLGGGLSYNHLALDKTITFTSLANNSQAIGFGYMAFIGTEWFPTKNKWTLSAEFAYRVETANLAGQSQFGVGGLSAGFGFGW